MGAFGELFGFDGRINRLGYLWRSVVAAVGLAFLAGVGFGALIFVVRPQSVTGADVWMQRLTVALVLMWLWSSVALASRRLRDIGLEPVYIVPLYAALWVVDTALLEPMSLIEPQTFAGLESGWSALQWLAVIPLLFWPSRQRADPVCAEYLHAEPTAYLNWREGR